MSGSTNRMPTGSIKRRAGSLEGGSKPVVIVIHYMYHRTRRGAQTRDCTWRAEYVDCEHVEVRRRLDIVMEEKNQIRKINHTEVRINMPLYTHEIRGMQYNDRNANIQCIFNLCVHMLKYSYLHILWTMRMNNAAY